MSIESNRPNRSGFLKASLAASAIAAAAIGSLLLVRIALCDAIIGRGWTHFWPSFRSTSPAKA
jgi:ABC-type phosphate transport system auxiliary subunit